MGIEIILVHFLSDYFIQHPIWLRNKAEYTVLGWLSCFLHCLIYTIVFIVIIFYITGGFKLSINIGWFLFLVFLSHFIPDKFARQIFYFLCFIRGETKPKKTLVYEVDGEKHSFLSFEIFNDYVLLYIEYYVIDNVLHLLFLYLIFKFFVQGV